MCLVSENDTIRKQMVRWESPRGARFITFSCYKRQPLLLNPHIADLFARLMRECLSRYDVKLLAWVVMPEHVHLLVERGLHDELDRPLALMKQRLAQVVIRRWQSLDSQNARMCLELIQDDQGNRRFWQRGGGFDRNIRDEAELLKTIHYIHHNPVKRGLVGDPTAWRWSSARWWMGKHDDEVPCDIPRSLVLWRGFI